MRNLGRFGWRAPDSTRRRGTEPRRMDISRINHWNISIVDHSASPRLPLPASIRIGLSDRRKLLGRRVCLDWEMRRRVMGGITPNRKVCSSTFGTLRHPSLLIFLLLLPVRARDSILQTSQSILTKVHALIEHLGRKIDVSISKCTIRLSISGGGVEGGGTEMLTNHVTTWPNFDVCLWYLSVSGGVCEMLQYPAAIVKYRCHSSMSGIYVRNFFLVLRTYCVIS